MVLFQRILTAVVLFIIVIGTLLADSLIYFEAVMGIAFAAALYEWLRLAQHSRLLAALMTLLMSLLTVLISLLYLFAKKQGWDVDYFVWFFMEVVFIELLIWIILADRIYLARKKGMTVNQTVSTGFALFMVPMAYLSILMMLEMFGLPFLISVLCVVWVADIMAYCSGMLFGRHKMCPAISPKKSYEGAIGAVISVIVFGYIAYVVTPDIHTLPNLAVNVGGIVLWVLTATFLVILSIAGDLFESVLKRQVNIKDSGKLLPGHGGVYDRLDAMMPTIPAGFFIGILYIAI